MKDEESRNKSREPKPAPKTSNQQLKLSSKNFGETNDKMEIIVKELKRLFLITSNVERSLPEV